MLEMIASSGVMTIRVPVDADTAELRRRAVAALDDGRRLVVLATKPGAEGLAFSVRPVGRQFMVSTVAGTTRTDTPAAAVAHGIDKSRGSWDHMH